MRQNLVILAGLGMVLLTAPKSRADGLLLAQCVEHTFCWNTGPEPWSDTLTGAELTILEETADSADLPFIVEQNTEFIIRVGETTATFSTSGGPVVETLGEFNGLSEHFDPCPTSLPYCETDTIGFFTVPDGATGATISGSFGNSEVSSTAGECLYLGAEGPCTLSGTSKIPEPTSIILLGTSLLGLALTLRRRLRA